MISTHSPLYRKAFEQYLRKGTAIEVFLKSVEIAEHHSTPLYIWHTAGDDRVRESHAANAGKVFAWAHPPGTGNPGEDFNCRCWAEPVEVDTTPLEILALLSGGGLVLRAGRVVIIRAGGAIIRRVIGREVPKKPEPRLDDTKTWPTPPREGKYREGDPSRNKPRSRGEKSLYDEKGGEWRYDPGDKYHNPHWNYKPSGKAQEWQNISVDGLPPRK